MSSLFVRRNVKSKQKPAKRVVEAEREDEDLDLYGEKTVVSSIIVPNVKKAAPISFGDEVTKKTTNVLNVRSTKSKKAATKPVTGNKESDLVVRLITTHVAPEVEIKKHVEIKHEKSPMEVVDVKGGEVNVIMKGLPKQEDRSPNTETVNVVMKGQPKEEEPVIETVKEVKTEAKSKASVESDLMSRLDLNDDGPHDMAMQKMVQAAREQRQRHRQKMGQSGEFVPFTKAKSKMRENQEALEVARQEEENERQETARREAETRRRGGFLKMIGENDDIMGAEEVELLAELEGSEEEDATEEDLWE
eukprot:Platyproteum_vivax@DN2562_c0_g1_i1.p1